MRRYPWLHLLVAVVAALTWVGLGGTFDRVASAATKVPNRSSAPAAASAGVARWPAPRVHRPLFPLPAAAALPEPCGLGQQPGSQLPTASLVSSWAALAHAPTRRVDLSAISGKGIWITDFRGEKVDVGHVVALARANGLHSLWIRVGSTSDGFYGGPVLRALAPLAHAAGLSVVAWDFPTLQDPGADAHRALQAFQAGADAFSPDIETFAEGTDLTVPRVTQYLTVVRAIAGDRPVIATVPRPTTDFLVSYPYLAEAPFVDAFAPMIYWSCTEPGMAVQSAVAVLSHLRPVVPIGQDYDMASEGGRVGLPSGLEIWRFLGVAHAFGAIGASLYDLESGGPVQLRSLGAFPWAPTSAPARAPVTPPPAGSPRLDSPSSLPSQLERTVAHRPDPTSGTRSFIGRLAVPALRGFADRAADQKSHGGVSGR